MSFGRTSAAGRRSRRGSLFFRRVSARTSVRDLVTPTEVSNWPRIERLITIVSNCPHPHDKLTFVSIHKFHETADFAALVRRTRRERGISQADLAERANISRSGLQKIEEGRGSPSLQTAIKLLRVLSLDIGALSRQDPFKRLEKGKSHGE